MLVFARLQNPTRRDPSFMKTFRLMGNYMVPGSYVRDDGRVEVAKFDWSEAIADHQPERRATHHRFLGPVPCNVRPVNGHDFKSSWLG